MNQIETTNGKKSAEAIQGPPVRGVTNDLSDQLTGACANAMEAADAQLSISALKTTRIVVLATFAILAILAMTIAVGYGLFLLDGCLANALSIPPLPVWFAPLVRGLIYVFVPATGLLYICHTTVGFDAKQSGL